MVDLDNVKIPHWYMKFILGTKLGMTQIFHDDGRVVPVTRVQAGPCIVTKIEKQERGAKVEIGCGEKKKLSKAETGHLNDLPPVRFMRSFKTEHVPGELKRGSVITVDMFEPGESITVRGNSKGKGFQGVVRRHGFHGAPASHGHKDQQRMPGSIGATDPARVFKGKKMPGRMGGGQVTVTNLEVVEVDSEKSELLIKGAVPGARGGLVMIQSKGELQVQESKTEKAEESIEPVEQQSIINNQQLPKEKKDVQEVEASQEN